MNKLLNPFEFLSNGKAFGWGLAGTAFALVLMIVVRSQFEWNVSALATIFATNLLLWIPLATTLYLLALVFSPSRIRAVDIFASNLFALLPAIVICGVSNMISGWMYTLNLDPVSFAGVMVRAGYNLLVILLSVTMVWSMVWGCFAYQVSANMKGWRGIVIFLICYVLVSVVIQTLVYYF